MTNLFIFLIGTCSINFCSFGVAKVDDFSALAVKVYDKELEIVDIEYYDLGELGFDVSRVIANKLQRGEL